MLPIFWTEVTGHEIKQTTGTVELGFGSLVASTLS